MQKLIYLIIAVVLIAILVLFLQSPQQIREPLRVTNLPWQITYDRSSSQVFGISLEKSTLAEAARALETEFQLAWFDNHDDSYSLEAFFERVTLAGLQAKVVLELDKGTYSKDYFMQNSGKAEILQSKAVKYPLADLVEELSQQTVLSIAYIPKVSLDEELIKSRFGVADKVIKITSKREHWLYPEKGLDIAVNHDAKEVLQYVSPKNYSRLVKKIEDERLKALKAEKNSSQSEKNG